jgi:hypothetical protein
LSSSTALADIELASWDSSKEMSEAAPENKDLRAGRTAEAFQGKESWAYLIVSPTPFLGSGTGTCQYGISLAACGRCWPGAHSNTEENREAMLLSEIHFQVSCHHSYLETRGLG